MHTIFRKLFHLLCESYLITGSTWMCFVIFSLILMYLAAIAFHTVYDSAIINGEN